MVASRVTHHEFKEDIAFLSTPCQAPAENVRTVRGSCQACLLSLASCAKECRAAALLQPPNGFCTVWTRFVLAVVNSPIRFIFSAVVRGIGIGWIDAYCRTSIDSFAKYVQDLFAQYSGPSPRNGVRALCRMYSGQEKRLGSIDISETANARLIGQKFFNAPSR